MERRIFLAIILAAVVMYGWQAFFMPPPPPARSSSQQAAAKPATPTAAPAVQEPEPAETQPEAPAAQTVKGEQAEREIVVDTAVAHVVLTNRGGRVLRWHLKDYQTPGGQPVDLVPSNTPANQPRPLSLRGSLVAAAADARVPVNVERELAMGQ